MVFYCSNRKVTNTKGVCIPPTGDLRGLPPITITLGPTSRRRAWANSIRGGEADLRQEVLGRVKPLHLCSEFST